MDATTDASSDCTTMPRGLPLPFLVMFLPLCCSRDKVYLDTLLKYPPSISGIICCHFQSPRDWHCSLGATLSILNATIPTDTLLSGSPRGFSVELSGSHEQRQQLVVIVLRCLFARDRKSAGDATLSSFVSASRSLSHGRLHKTKELRSQRASDQTQRPRHAFS